MNKSTLVKKHKGNSLETVPYILSRISAGFPSPADDYIENNLSISELLVKNQLSTFLMIRRPPRSTPLYSSAASDVYKRQELIF